MTDGPENGTPVILLHGFTEFSYTDRFAGEDRRWREKTQLYTAIGVVVLLVLLAAFVPRNILGG